MAVSALLSSAPRPSWSSFFTQLLMGPRCARVYPPSKLAMAWVLEEMKYTGGRRGGVLRM